MWTTLLLAGLFLVIVSFAEASASKKKSDTLEVKWGPPETRQAKTAFFKMPRNKQEAISANPPFVPVSQNDTCGGDGKFGGHRYYRKGDLAVILIFDKNGYVAGIQTAFPKSHITRVGGVTKIWFERQREAGFVQDDTIDGVDAYVETAYFSDPSKLCSKGKKKQPDSFSRLLFQTGSTPQEYMKVPFSEERATSKLWTKGACYDKMGTHYYYNTSVNMDCLLLRPLFLMYNEGRLASFGFVGLSHFDNAHYEYMTPDLFPSFFGPNKTPKCVNELYEPIGGYTTMHVFFYDSQNITCNAASTA